METTFVVILNLIIDLFFFIDIIITFRTSFIDDTGNEIMDPKIIGWEYLKG